MFRERSFSETNFIILTLHQFISFITISPFFPTFSEKIEKLPIQNDLFLHKLKCNKKRSEVILCLGDMVVVIHITGTVMEVMDPEVIHLF